MTKREKGFLKGAKGTIKTSEQAQRVDPLISRIIRAACHCSLSRRLELLDTAVRLQKELTLYQTTN